MVDPLLLKAAKAAPSVLRDGYARVRRELARRSPGDGKPYTFASLEAPLNEAIRVLSLDADSLLEWVKTQAKRAIARPDVFKHPTAHAWIRTEIAQKSLTEAARQLIAGQSDVASAKRALDHYTAILADEEHADAPSGEEVYGTALDFIQRSIERDLTLADQVLLTAIGGVREQIAGIAIPIPGDIVDDHVRSETLKIRQRRFFHSSQTQEEAERLAGRLLDGNLRGTGAATRSWALAWCARFLCTARPDLALGYIEQARALGGMPGEEIKVAEAFLAANEDWRRGVRMLDVETSPLQATAAFQIARSANLDDALTWLDEAGIEARHLDPDGLYVLVVTAVTEKQWPRALKAVRNLTDVDFEATPALLWVAATVIVAAQMPEEFRQGLLQDIPIHPADFRIPEDKAALAERRTARHYLETASLRCEELNLTHEKLLARRYALWLALRDPEAREAALQTLRQYMDDRGSALVFVPLALSFDLDVDSVKAEAAVRAELARGGESSPVVLTAVIALLFERGEQDPTSAKKFLDDYRDLLARSLEPASLLSIEVQILKRAGKTEEAAALLRAQDPGTMPASLRDVLSTLVEGEDLAPSLESLEAMQAEGRHVLPALLQRHQEDGFSERYLELARDLLRTTPNKADAVQIVNFLVESRNSEHALSLLKDLGDLVEESDRLLEHFAHLSFEAGEIAEADVALKMLEARRSNEHDRQLRYHILVTAGRWPELDVFIERQWAERDERAPLELVQCANVAARVGSGRVAEFVRAAVERAPNDPQVLVGAYSAATSAGIEEVLEEAGRWIMQAADLSGADGPIQRQSLEELLKNQPAWEKQVEEANRALAAGEVPLAMAAEALRRPWTELQLVPLLMNRHARDRRHQSLVALYSGHLTPSLQEDLPNDRLIALDRSAILTLASLGLLDDVLDAFGQTLIAHSLLDDLFNERSRIEFHQPSRIAFANHLGMLLSQGSVSAFAPTAAPSLKLMQEIGVTLAELLTEAASQKEGQHLVVHPFPITRAGSLLSDPVSLDAYGDHLCSCSAVVDALVDGGRLLHGEVERAEGYLKLHDRRWPNEPKVEEGATLYLSDLSVSYLRYTGILDRIAGAGIKVVISKSELEEAKTLRELEVRAKHVSGAIEQIRGSLEGRIKSGRVRLDRTLKGEDEVVPMMAIGGLAESSQLLVCDDRFLNRYSTFEHAKGTTRILSTLELLSSLSASGRINPKRTVDLRTKLRQAGVAFIPLDTDELVDALRSSRIEDGVMRETGELRSIRENIRLIQLRGWFDPASDTTWLVQLNSALADAVIAQWSDAISDDVARARSNWLVRLLDSRDWAESIARPQRYDLGAHAIVLSLSKVATNAFALKGDAAVRFADWFEHDILNPLWEAEPHLRPIFLDHYRGLVVSIGSDHSSDEDLRLTPAQHMRLYLQMLPKFLQDALVESADFRKKVEATSLPSITIGEATFLRDRFLETVRKVYAEPVRPVVVEDDAGRSWSLTTQFADGTWPITLRDDDVVYTVRGISALLPTAELRLAAFKLELRRLGIEPDELPDWCVRLEKDLLSPDEIEELEAEIETSPGSYAAAVSASMERGEGSLSLLVPEAREYYERLVGSGAADTVDDFAENILVPLFEATSRKDKLARAKRMLLLASHPRLLRGQLADFSAKQWRELQAWVLSAGDPLASTGFCELALEHSKGRPPIQKLIMPVVASIEALDPEAESGPLNLLSSLFVLVDGEISRRGTLAAWPPFRRRIATLAQAALLTRLVFGRIDTAHFAAWCLEQRGWRFLVQSLADLCREPRWRPEYVAADQIKHDLIARIVNVASDNAANLIPTLREPLLGEISLRSRMSFPQAFWPGPTEGALPRDTVHPSEKVLAELRATFAKGEIDSKSIALLLNLSTIFILPKADIEAAVAWIVAGGPDLLATADSKTVQPILSGLAYLAAAHRNVALADHVRMLGRIWRQRLTTPDISDEIQIALAASAAHADMDAWRLYLGAWVLELAVGMDRTEGAYDLLAWLDALCAIDPPLRATTGRARASLALVLQL